MRLAELADEIETPGEGQIKALIISGGNPVVSGPNGAALDAALLKLDLLVAIDLVQRESHRHADWLIPAAHWLEREEFNPLISGLSEGAFVQMGKEVVKKPKTVKHEWEFLRDLTIKLGAPLMNRAGVNSVARVSRLVAACTGNPYHAFGPSWISKLLVMRSRKARWRDIKKAKHGLSYGKTTIGKLRSKLNEVGKEINLVPTELAEYLKGRLNCARKEDPKFPLRLLSRRRRHAMNSWYNEITADRVKNSTGDWVDMHPDTGRALGIKDGSAVRVVSKTAEVAATARYSPELKENVAVMEQGWGSRIFAPKTGEASVTGVNRNLLVANDDLDPLTGVPRLNGTPVRIEPH